MIPDRVIEVAKKFKGRLEDIWVETVLDYVDHNEWGIALETLCDYITEYDVLISMEEYDEIMKLATYMEFDLNEGRYRCLKDLIK